MSRTLRRPMFRGGGKIESRGTGITSGLDDRPGYANGVGPVDLNRLKTESEQLLELQKQMGVFQAPKETKGFMNAIGPAGFLALAQRGFEFAGKGGDETFGQKLAGTAADATGDIASIIKAKKEKNKELLEKQNLMKAGNIQSVYEQLGKEAIQKSKSEGTGYQIEKKIELIGTLNNDISELEKQLQGAEGVEKNEIQRKIDLKNDQLGVLVKEFDAVATQFLKSDEGEYLFNDISDELEREINPSTKEEWKTSDPGFYAEVLNRVRKALRSASEFKKGGRVEMEQGGMTTQNAEQETQNLSYKDLRSRLPQEITNDIVNLISQSNQAFSDFANIRTQADVDSFNKRYNVNLVLPQEA
tara:strand:- start:545 stop:1618 length:1074 start_codon:yes stop_codon:yes gene_type:complete